MLHVKKMINNFLSVFAFQHSGKGSWKIKADNLFPCKEDRMSIISRILIGAFIWASIELFSSVQLLLFVQFV